MFDSVISRRRFFGTALTAAVSAGSLAACSGANAASSSQQGDAATAQTNTPKPAIVVVSFGTSYASSRHITIGAIESDIREAFANYDVYRAFTSQIIIDHIEKDTGRHINNFEQTMDQLAAAGVKEVIVQPTHLMAGYEYQDVANALENYRSKFDKVTIGAPLLATEEDQKAVAEAVKEATKSKEDEKTAVCLMGHGTEADSNSVYTSMQKVFRDLGYNNYFVATVEASPTFDDVATAAKEAGYSKAILRPFMVVAGDHANNDMADVENADSFASIMKASGFEVECIIEGLGQLNAIDEIYVQHTQEAIKKL